MADEDVTVNVVGNLTGLQDTLDKTQSALQAFANQPVTKEVNIKDYQGSAPEIKLPDYKDLDMQLAALIRLSDDLAEKMAKLEDSGKGGSAFAKQIEDAMDQAALAIERLKAAGVKGELKTRAPNYVDLSFEEMEEEDEDKGSPAKPPKLPKPGKAAKPPKLPSQPEPEDVAKGSAIGLVIGGAILAGVAAAVMLAKSAIEAASQLVQESVAAAMDAEKRLRTLSNTMGGSAAGSAVKKQAWSAAEGTGIDPRELEKLIPDLEAKTRGQLSQGSGLQMVVDVAARLDPTRVGEFAGAIEQAYAGLRQGDNIKGTLEQMVSLGMISGATGRELEMMGRMGYRMSDQWSALQAALIKGNGSTQEASKSFSGLMAQLQTKISTTWYSMLTTIGDKIAESLGPALTGAVDTIGKLQPFLISMAEWVGSVIGSVVSWAAGAIQGAVNSLQRLKSMFVGGEMGEFILLSFSYGMMTALNAFIDGLAKGIQYAVDLFISGLSLLINGNLWSAIGNHLVAQAYSFLGVIAGMGTLLFSLVTPVMSYVQAALIIAANMAAGVLKIAVAAMMPKGMSGKDELWNEGQAQKNMTWDDAKAQADSDNRDFVDAGTGLAAGFMGKAADHWGKAGDQIGKAMAESDKTKAWGDYEGVGVLDDQIAGVKKQMDDIWNKNAPTEEATKEKEKKASGAGLADVVGQGGPKSIADSLQSVGGGGFAGGISWEDNMLTESRTQSAELKTLVGKTPTASGAFGGGKGSEGGSSVTTLLSNIHNTTLSILQAVVAMGKGGSGTTVTTRT